MAKSDEYAIAEFCAALGVTRSGYHTWECWEPGARARADAALLLFIAMAHQEIRHTYGSPRTLKRVVGA